MLILANTDRQVNFLFTKAFESINLTTEDVKRYRKEPDAERNLCMKSENTLMWHRENKPPFTCIWLGIQSQSQFNKANLIF